MLVTISTAQTKTFYKLVNKLLKTTLKMAKVGLKKVSIDISFVDEDEIQRLNREFRKKDKVTSAFWKTKPKRPLRRL